MRSALLFALALCAPIVVPLPVRAASDLPAVMAGNVVVLVPCVPGHGPIRLLLDSGGYDLVDRSAIARFDLRSSPIVLGAKPRVAVDVPPFVPGASLPPSSTRWLVARPGALRDGFYAEIDATLGPSWLVAHPVTIDYPGHRVTLTSASARAISVPLAVKSYRPPATSLPAPALATLQVTVAGERLTMLLDTGATARIRPIYRALMPDRSAVRQVNFADPTLLARWHRLHPAWRYIAAGAEEPGDPRGTYGAMILVPDLRVGSAHAWPTWFVARNDASTYRALSRAVGRAVSGDLGGEALRRWRVTFNLRGSSLLLE